MKKFLYGAMMLLAAVGFTSCDDKNKNNKTEEEVTSLNLNKTEYTLAPQEKLQLKATTNTGKVKTLVWETSNAEVATVSDNGEVTAMAYGEANITCSLKDNANIKAVCKITVESALKTLKFTHATVGLPNIATIDSTKVYDVEMKLVDNSQVTVKAYIAKNNVFLFSDGFYLDQEAKLVSENKDKAYVITLPTYTYVIPANLNPQYFEKETDYVSYVAGAYIYETSDEIGPRKVKAGDIDEEIYMTHMKAAFESFNKYVETNNDEDELNYWIERYKASDEGVSGAQLNKYTYSEQSGNYLDAANPSAIVTKAEVRLGAGDGLSDYMYTVVACDITVKPLGGLFGCSVKQNTVTYKYSFESDNVIYEDPIHYTIQKTTEE